MFIILVGVYIFFLAFILGFFTLIKIGAYKFKSLNSNIEKYTRFFFVLLSILTIIGFSLIYYSKYKIETSVVDETKSSESTYY